MAGVVARGAHLAHESHHAMTIQGPMDFRGTKLRSTVDVKYAAGDVASASDRVADGGEIRPGLHPLVHRLGGGQIRADVLDGADVAHPFLGCSVMSPARGAWGPRLRTRSSWTWRRLVR
jgi:hypothetical protein